MHTSAVGSPADEELLDSPTVVLGHNQHGRIQLLSAAAQQGANAVVVNAATHDLNLVGDLHKQTTRQHRSRGNRTKCSPVVF